MTALTASSSVLQRFRSGLRVMRGQQIGVSAAIFDEAVKRASMVIYPQALYGAWGEPPPAEVEAVPTLFRTSEAVKAAVFYAPPKAPFLTSMDMSWAN